MKLGPVVFNSSWRDDNHTQRVFTTVTPCTRDTPQQNSCLPFPPFLELIPLCTFVTPIMGDRMRYIMLSQQSLGNIFQKKTRFVFLLVNIWVKPLVDTPLVSLGKFEEILKTDADLLCCLLGRRAEDDVLNRWGGCRRSLLWCGWNRVAPCMGLYRLDRLSTITTTTTTTTKGEKNKHN